MEVAFDAESAPVRKYSSNRIKDIRTCATISRRHGTLDKDWNTEGKTYQNRQKKIPFLSFFCRLSFCLFMLGYLLFGNWMRSFESGSEEVVNDVYYLSDQWLFYISIRKVGEWTRHCWKCSFQLRD